MNLYEIIQSLRNAKGNLEKQAILDANKGNELFRQYMRAVYAVDLNYYMKKLPKVTGFVGDQEFAINDINFMVDDIAGRKYTGHDALATVGGWLSVLNNEGRELMQYILDRKIGASVGDTMVLKTWPDLYFIPPYMRCSLMDAKAKERFAKLKKFYVQTKADGSFAYIVKRLDGSVDVITRQGNKYPQEFAQKMARGLAPGKVLVGELLVYEKQGVQGWGETEYLVARKEANGLLTSALKDGDRLDERYEVRMTAWDLLTQEEFEAGKSTRKYSDRLDALSYEIKLLEDGQVELIFTETVYSLAEAYAVYTDHTSRGLEGCVAKDPDSLWKDGTAKDNVKMKLKFEVEMRVIGMYEGEGKAAGMLGGVHLQSEDGEIVNDCGSGFSDEQRKLFWDNPELILNEVVAIEANDVTQARDGRKKPSLSLPIFCEVRYDKRSVGADTAARIMEQLEAAKNGQ